MLETIFMWIGIVSVFALLVLTAIRIFKRKSPVATQRYRRPNAAPSWLHGEAPSMRHKPAPRKSDILDFCDYDTTRPSRRRVEQEEVIAYSHDVMMHCGSPSDSPITSTSDTSTND